MKCPRWQFVRDGLSIDDRDDELDLVNDHPELDLLDDLCDRDED